MSDTHEPITGEIVVAPSRGLHPLAAMMRDSGALVDPSTARELLAVQRDWAAGEARGAFARSLIAATSELPSAIDHDTSVSFRSTAYTYTTLATMIDAVRPALRRNGLVLTHDVSTDRVDGRPVCRVEAVLTHEAGHVHRGGVVEAAPSNKDGLTPGQAVEATITTLRRTTLLAILGLSTSKEREERQTPASGGTDESRTRRVAARLIERGIPVEEAESLVGRERHEWTPEDVTRIISWAKERT